MSFDPVTVSIVKILEDRHAKSLVINCWRTIAKKSDKKKEDVIYEKLKYLIERIDIYESRLPDYEGDFMELSTSLYPETILKIYMRIKEDKNSYMFKELLKRAVDFQIKDRGIWYNFYGENL